MDENPDIEAERRRLAQRLDQDIIGSLNLLLAQANMYQHALQGNAQAQMALSVMHSLIMRLVQKARDLQSNLHPTILETLGLEPALEQLAAQENRARGLHIRLNFQRLRERLPAPVEVALFRAVQDLIEYRAIHAHASEIVIQLNRQAEQVTFNYQDNGITSEYAQIVDSVRQQIQHTGGHVTLHTGTDDGMLHLTIRFTLQPPIDLTPRELEILQNVADGKSNKAIAESLFISARTVNFHLDNIYTKLGVNTRTEAVVLALQNGWIQKPG